MRALRDLDEAYLPGLSVSPGPYLDRYTDLSAQARRMLTWQDVAYGPGEAERLHYFPAPQPGAPLLIFVHGGYWQELTETESSFAAPGVHARGWAFAALGYGLAPEHRLDEIVAMVRRGVTWLHRNAARLGFDPGRIVLAGHSAGAQLAAMCFGGAPIRAAVLVSGLYDLEPLLATSIGAAIGLTPDEAARNSPARRLPPGTPPLLAGFAEQQDLLAAAARAARVPLETVIVSGRHHFDLPLGLADPDDPLGKRVLAILD
jgi:arylformamidase